MPSSTPFLAIGRNDAEVFGLSAAERARRFAVKGKLEPVAEIPAHGGVVLANLAFAWDPAWLRYLADEPGFAVTHDGALVLAHAPDPASAREVQKAMAEGGGLPPGAWRAHRAEGGEPLYNHALRKREQLYVAPLTPQTARAVEKASYDAAYKGVTDLLTLYLWRGAAFHLTRWAAKAGLTPNMVTSIGAAFCVWAFFLFMQGHFWGGLAAGLVFMVLDTVDGKLARCTGTSSKWGNIFDHGIDQVHPPFWYWAWAHGLAAYGTPFADGVFWPVMMAIVGGYVVQRLVEGAFMHSFGGMHIHVWRRLDSQFRLVTARRNPNVVILFASLLVGRPDWGLIAVAVWTLASCGFHIVRLVQALALRLRGGQVASWLA